VRNADVILLLDDGELVAKGQHDELLQTSELYVDILDTQFDEDAVGVGFAEQEEVMSI
jgi:ATP-binding cassette subfamily B protein